MESIAGRNPCTATAAKDSPLRRLPRRRSWGRVHAVEQTFSSAGAPIKDFGSCSILGTSRQTNEDRFDYKFVQDATDVGEISAYVAVFDGHGGIAVSEALETAFPDMLNEYWSKLPPEAAVAKAFVEMDRKLLQRPPGFWGTFGERGVGGSKCGATGAIALIFRDKGGQQKLLAANIGDSRVVLVRGGTATQLTVDHVPDSEEERKRIERENPNPMMPLVRFVGGTWRVGGILALSRAFGDAYMKGNLQFEGVDAGSDYSTGFGVVADPYTSVTDLKKDDAWLLVHTDGLNNTETRGGGGGLTNEQIAKICAGYGDNAQTLAQKLAEEAQRAGSTDDVSVVCIKLNL